MTGSQRSEKMILKANDLIEKVWVRRRETTLESIFRGTVNIRNPLLQDICNKIVPGTSFQNKI